MQKINDTRQVEENKIVIGPYKPKEKFLEFIGTKGNIKFHANEAIIEGKYLSGLDLENIKFKLTICDEGTVNLEEVDTELTTSEQRGRLVEIISEKTVTPFNKKMVINELPFTSVQTFKNPATETESNIKLYLSVDYETPISKLASFFDDEEETAAVSSEQYSKVDSLLSALFGDIYEETPELEKEEFVEDEEKTESQKMLEESFKKMKEEKIEELKRRLEQQEKELKIYTFEKSQSEKKIETAKTDIRVLESRIESLQPSVEKNGYVFFVSERLNEKVNLEKDIEELIRNKVSKIKSINVDAFMKIFEDGEYKIRLGKVVDGTVTEIDYNLEELRDVLGSLLKLGFTVINGDENYMAYVGEMTWHQIVDKMIKLGFDQNADFDKMCGSNSYSVGKFDKMESQEDQHSCSNKEFEIVANPVVTKEIKIENMNKFIELERFDEPTDIVILGDDQELGKKFDITDDESAFDIYQNGKRKATLSCTGFGSVMTLSEYQNLYIEKGHEMGEWGIIEGVVVTGFCGKLGIAALDDNGNFRTDFDLDDYIQHQSDDYCEVVIDVPCGNIYKLNEDLSLPTAILRDVKIDKVLDKQN